MIGLIAGVEEVDDHDVEALTVTMAAADPLLDALRVPRQVVVDDERAELQVDAFCAGFGGDHDVGTLAVGAAEVVDERCPAIHLRRSGDAIAALAGLQPFQVDACRVFARVGAAERYEFACVSVGGQKAGEVLLGAAGFREEDRLAGRVQRGHLVEADLKCSQQRLCLGIGLNALGCLDEGSDLCDLAAHCGGVEGSRSVDRHFVALGCVARLLEVIAFDVVLYDQLFEQCVIDTTGSSEHLFQPVADGLQCRYDRMRTRCEQLAQDQGGQVTLPAR